ncbi:MAG: hypothetical protein GY769_11825, partial [bacterium]|nr:hypothetical protein [bacterium]
MRRREAIRRSVAFGAVLMAALAVTATAQPAPPDPAPFGESVDVQLINVEVWVTDRQGNAVTGLGLDDFEVREDGEPVGVTNFAEVRPRAPAPSEPAPPVEAAVEQPTPDSPLEIRDLLGTREAEQAGV